MFPSDRAKHSGNKPLTKIQKLPDYSSPLLVKLIAKNAAISNKYKIHTVLQNNRYQLAVRTEIFRFSLN
jgi:hypothetical protein